jgi:glycosyltransferase involved in cell wall biosynthesis
LVSRISKSLLLKNKICEYLFFHFAHKFIFVSGETVSLAKKYYSFDDKKIEIVHNGIDLVFFNPERRFTITKPLKLVFYNGINSGINRNLPELIEILNQFDQFPIRLYVLGERFNHYDKKSKFEITFIDPMPTRLLADFFSDKHIFIKSPGFDSFSIMSIEAMSSGLICIVSNSVGMKYLIKNEVNGFVYDEKNLDCILKILIKILNDRNEAAQISKKAVEIYSMFTWDKAVDNYMKIYNEVIIENNLKKSL